MTQPLNEFDGRIIKSTEPIKVYWSGIITDDWGSNHDIMTFFYIPNKWWSFKAWKLALEFRWFVNQELIKRIQK